MKTENSNGNSGNAEAKPETDVPTEATLAAQAKIEADKEFAKFKEEHPEPALTAEAKVEAPASTEAAPAIETKTEAPAPIEAAPAAGTKTEVPATAEAAPAAETR